MSRNDKTTTLVSLFIVVVWLIFVISCKTDDTIETARSLHDVAISIVSAPEVANLLTPEQTKALVDIEAKYQASKTSAVDMLKTIDELCYLLEDIDTAGQYSEQITAVRVGVEMLIASLGDKDSD